MAYCGPSGTLIAPIERARGEASPVIEWSLRVLWPHLVEHYSHPRYFEHGARPTQAMARKKRQCSGR